MRLTRKKVSELSALVAGAGVAAFVVFSARCGVQPVDGLGSRPEVLGTETSISNLRGDGLSTGDRLGLRQGEVANTLDDGPVPESLEIAQFLSDQQIPVTYFMIGRNVRSFPAIGREIAALPGVIIANHSQDHKRAINSVPCIACDGAEYAKSQIVDADTALKPLYAINKPSFFFFRAPGGNFFRDGRNDELAELAEVNRVASQYVGPVRWDVDGDVNPVSNGGCGTGQLTPRRCADIYLNQTLSLRSRGHGVVILAHDIHAGSREMIKLLVEDLRAEGFRFVALDKDKASVAKIGKVKPNDQQQEEFGDATFSSLDLGGGSYRLIATAPNAARTQIFIDRLSSPLKEAAGDTLDFTQTFTSLGTRFFTIRAFDADGKQIANLGRSLSVVNTPVSGTETCLDLKITSGGANFRASPNGIIIVNLPEGTQVQKLGSDGDWTRVRANQELGFVFTSLLELNCN
jgi:peptidoglycan/xylan/chitin deacetylase (PgdA/CDA1 family)